MARVLMEQMIGGPYVSLACSPSRAARVLLRVQIGTWLFHCFARSLAASEVILKSTKIDLRNKDGRRKREREGGPFSPPDKILGSAPGISSIVVTFSCQIIQTFTLTKQLTSNVPTQRLGLM